MEIQWPPTARQHSFSNQTHHQHRIKLGVSQQNPSPRQPLAQTFHDSKGNKIKMRNPTRINIQSITDFDNDSIPNLLDCEPRNPRLQHIKPNIAMRKELESLPTTFLVTDLSPTQATENDFYLLNSKDARRHCPQAVRDIWGILKRYPHIITAIKKAKPKTTIYYAGIVGTEALDWTGTHLKYKRFRNIRRIKVRKPNPKEPSETVDKRYPIEGESRSIMSKKQRRLSAGTIFHEAYHMSGSLWHRNEEAMARTHAEAMLQKRESKGKHLPPEAFNYPPVKRRRRWI